MKVRKICCPICRSEEGQNRNGRTRSGSQRYMCRACRKVYTPSHKWHGHSNQVRVEAVMLCLDGLSQHDAARVTGVSQQSIANWLRAALAAYDNFLFDELTRRKRPKWIEELLGMHRLLVQHRELRGRGKPCDY